MIEDNKFDVKIDVLHDTMNHLSDFLELENKALADHNMDEVAASQDKKKALGDNYYGQMQYVAANPKMFLGLDDAIRKRMKQVAKRLDEQMSENDRLLKLGIDVNNRILETIMGAAKKHGQRNSVYSSKGTLGMGKTSSPVSYNQVL
ncbi:MAG: flagellar protein FlgN [Alphaproteobacteria bacterium]|nr:flagellar protein FlgN [Alphaproteobacteria bacterium]